MTRTNYSLAWFKDVGMVFDLQCRVSETKGRYLVGERHEGRRWQECRWVSDNHVDSRDYYHAPVTYLFFLLYDVPEYTGDMIDIHPTP